MNQNAQPIVIKRIIKGGGHHGGAWKVAYADFVTAMMAFFLLLWLMGSTNKEEKAAISEYFNNPSAEEGTSAMPKPGGTDGPGGAASSVIDMGGGFDMPTQAHPDAPATLIENKSVANGLDKSEAAAQEKEKKEKKETPDSKPDAKTAAEIAQQAEVAHLKEMAKKLLSTISQLPELAAFKDQLLIDITNEGLRIQIVDKENRPMFDVGSANLLPHADLILREITKMINQSNNRISITGHTDARPFTRPDYSNWELSADRANAARRALTEAGLSEDRIAQVVGLASSKLFKRQEPMNPINRRIAIIVLKDDGGKAAIDPEKGESITPQEPQQPQEPAAPPPVH